MLVDAVGVGSNGKKWLSSIGKPFLLPKGSRDSIPNG